MEMTRLCKAWKAMKPFPTLRTAAWKTPDEARVFHISTTTTMSRVEKDKQQLLLQLKTKEEPS